MGVREPKGTLEEYISRTLVRASGVPAGKPEKIFPQKLGEP